MSFKTWHTYGYGICTDHIGECSIERLEKLLHKAPDLRDEIHQWMTESDIEAPTWDDYMNFDQDYYLGIATILREVIAESEGLELTACDDFEGSKFLLFTKAHPWELKWREKFLSEKRVAKIIGKYVRILTDQPVEIAYYEVENGG